MRTYRVKYRHGIWLLQRRRWIFLWETMERGTRFKITAAAIYLEKTKRAPL
jgi:hypothetical protein